MLVSSTFISVVLILTFIPASKLAAQIREENQENTTKLQTLRKQIEKSSERAGVLEDQAREIREEISLIQKNLINSAAKIQIIEEDIFIAEDNLLDLRVRELELKKNLSTKNFEMASTLGAMQRLSIQKANIVAFKPNDALNTLRTTSLLKVILPNLKNRALIIENDLSDLDNIRAEMRQQSIELKKNRAKLVTVNNEIDDLLKKRIGRQSNIEYSTIKERERLRVFAETAINLEDLIKKIASEIILREEAAITAQKDLRDKPNHKHTFFPTASISTPRSSLSFARAKGNIALPARGSIYQIYNQLLPTGQRAKGIIINTHSGAPVVAPHDGRIVFSGIFRSYGQLLIIDHGEGYHTLLSGMKNINGIVGQSILKGEPVGQMSLEKFASDSHHKLYVELRQKGKPINPMLWIMAMDRAVK